MGTNRVHVARVARGVVAILGLAALGGCANRSSGGGSSASSASSMAPAATSPALRGVTPLAAPAPAPSPASSRAPTPPSPAPASSGSGGTSVETGTLARSVTTAAQPGLPSLQVGYKLLVPKSYVFDPARPVPLVVSEPTYISYWEPIAEAEGFLVAEQQGYLGNGGFTFDYDPLVLQGILQDVESTWNVDTKAVYLTGFSAGAHFSYEIGLENADLFAGLGICSGDLRVAIQDGVWIQGSAVQPAVPRAIPVSIRHGTQDPVVPVAAGEFAAAELQLARFPVDYAELPSGHTVDTSELQGIWDFLKTRRLP